MYSLFVPCFGNSLFVMTLGTQCLQIIDIVCTPKLQCHDVIYVEVLL